jgi:hypothetical protein
MTTTTDTREQLAQQTAEYIANVLMPTYAELAKDVEIVYVNGKKPPTSVEEIKAMLLDGRLFISWMDDRVIAAMRTLHGNPTSHLRSANRCPGCAAPLSPDYMQWFCEACMDAASKAF